MHRSSLIALLFTAILLGSCGDDNADSASDASPTADEATARAARKKLPLIPRARELARP